jgi:multidrug efflux pump subunit AcrA (membrane-fusion protein)
VIFYGKVEKKANIAKSIKAGNPVKYFEITVLIEQPDLTLIKPGNKVTATLLGNEPRQRLTVPLQAVFHDDEGSYVYLQSRGKLSKKTVTLGVKNFAEVEITTGLVVGERVALYQP